MRVNGPASVPLPHLILASLARSPLAHLHSPQHKKVTAFSPAKRACPHAAPPTPPALLACTLHARFRVWTGPSVSAALLPLGVF